MSQVILPKSIDSKFRFITVAAQRAKQLQAGAKPRVDTRSTHGTGCTLSSAIAANLALGKPLEDAVLEGIQYLRAGLEHGLFPGRGFGLPDHFPPSFARRSRSSGD